MSRQRWLMRITWKYRKYFDSNAQAKVKPLSGLTNNSYYFTDACAKTTTIEQSSPLHFFPALFPRYPSDVYLYRGRGPVLEGLRT